MCLWGGGDYLQLRLGGIIPLGENILAQKGADLPPLPFWKSLSPSQIQPSLTQAKELKSWVHLCLWLCFCCAFGNIWNICIFAIPLVNVWWVLCIFDCSKTLSAFLINPDLTKLTSDLIWGQQRNACEKDRRKTRGVGLHQFARSARPKIQMQTYSCWAKMPYMMFAGLSR